MMSLDLKQLKEIDDVYKLPVFGYIRKVENELCCTITMLIYYLCLAYFYESDFFDECGDNILISENKTRITVLRDGSKYDRRHQAFCNQIIDSRSKQTAKWKIKINKMIDKMDDETYFRIFLIISNDNKGIYCTGGYGFSNDKCTITNSSGNHSGLQFTIQQNDIIQVVLNTDNATIGIIKNEQPMHIIWTHINIGDNIQYQLAINAMRKDLSISLINFVST